MGLIDFWASQWDLHADRAVLIGGLALAYLVGLRIVARRSGEGVPWGAALLFFLGLASLALAVLSPLHHLADRYLFSAHMAQHELLTLVAPPLLLLGTPAPLLRWVPRPRWLASLGHSQVYPVLAFGLFNAVFAFIHFPTLYEALFADELTHFLTHGVLLTAGLVTWLPLFSPVPEVFPRLALPGQMLYCFLQTIPGSLVGSLITLSDQIVYRYYGSRPLQLGIAPLADQQVGGLLMWVGGGSYFLLLLTILFFIWAHREEANAYG